MATFKYTQGVSVYRDRLVGGMVRRGYGSVKNLGRYAASRMACWPKRPSSTAALT